MRKKRFQRRECLASTALAHFRTQRGDNPSFLQQSYRNFLSLFESLIQLLPSKSRYHFLESFLLLGKSFFLMILIRATLSCHLNMKLRGTWCAKYQYTLVCVALKMAASANGRKYSSPPPFSLSFPLSLSLSPSLSPPSLGLFSRCFRTFLMEKLSQRPSNCVDQLLIGYYVFDSSAVSCFQEKKL